MSDAREKALAAYQATFPEGCVGTETIPDDFTAGWDAAKADLPSREAVKEALAGHEIDLFPIEANQLGEPDERGARVVVKSRCMCGALIDNDAGDADGWPAYSAHRADVVFALMRGGE